MSSTSLPIIRGVKPGHEPAVPVVLGRVHVEDREADLRQRHLVLVGDERAADPELNVALSWLTARTSACLVTAQNPGPSGSGCR